LFKPAHLARFLRMPLYDLTKKAQDGSLILKELTSLHEQMEAFSTGPQKIALLDRYFHSQIALMNPSPGVADKALYLMEQNNIASIEAIASHLGITTRHLEIQFKRQVGLSPKTYARILRFKRIERLLQTRDAAPWKHIAPTREYYDQNHFIKEFKRFTNRTPSSYLQTTFELNSSYLLP
jgi:AraC-like DNA-binding protein